MTAAVSVGVGRLFIAVCLCLSVCPQHNSKKNDPKVFKLGVGNDLGISYRLLGFEVERSRVNKCIFHTNNYCAYVKSHLTDNSNTAWV